MQYSVRQTLWTILFQSLQISEQKPETIMFYRYIITFFSRVVKDILAMSWENLFVPHANNKGADQPAHPRSLISTFVVRCLDSILPILAESKMSSPCSWAGQFESYLVANPEDMFSHDEAHIMVYSMFWNKCDAKIMVQWYTEPCFNPISMLYVTFGWLYELRAGVENIHEPHHEKICLWGSWDQVRLKPAGLARD